MGPLPASAATQHNPAASKAAHDIRAGFKDVLRQLGSAHMQHGKFYRLDQSLQPATLSLLRNVKQTLDPRGIINPGALGL